MDKNILDLYQEFTPTTAVYPAQGEHTMMGTMYCALGLTGETGEVAEKIKKYYRDGSLNVQDIEKEIGDVMWYMSQLCNELGISLTSALVHNRDKLVDRQNRGKLRGSGDDR